MNRLGLRAHGLRSYHQALADDHSIRIQVSVLTLDHQHLASIDQRVHDGQVDVSASADVSRSCEVVFSDETRAISFDSDSPANGALFADRMLRIEYGVKVPGLGWIDAPIFTGPIHGLRRDNQNTIVTAQGKESLARSPVTAWRPMTVRKGTRKVDAIRRIMRERAGENRFALPDLHARLPKAVTLGRESEPWKVCQQIARSMDKQLYYDGAGRLRLRAVPDNALYTFRDGTGGVLLPDSPLEVTFDISNVRNLVWVKGGKPRAKRKQNETREEFQERQEKERGIRYSAVAARSHPLSPWRLGRDNAPRFMPHVIENDHIRSEKEARQRARKVLRNLLRQHVDVGFACMVVPHLDVLDPVRVRTGDFDFTFRLKEFSIPLHAGGQMSVGSTRNVRPRGRHHHRRKGKRR